MLDHYNIPTHIYYRHYKKKSFEEIVNNYKPSTTVKDHLGQTFSSEAAMCKAHGINYQTYYSRREKNLPLEEALDATKQQVIDHLGKTHQNEKAMCDAHNISPTTYLKRRQNNWSLEEALTNSVKETLIKDRTGETKISRYGQKMTITKYRGANDLDVTFEDDQTVTTTYSQFKKNSITNPNLKTGHRIPQIAYTLIDGTVALYYKCEKCGLEDVGTWQQIAAHQCQKSDDQIGVLTSLPVRQHEHKNKTA